MQQSITMQIKIKRKYLKELKKSDYFKRIINGKLSKKTYIKEDFERSTKKYICVNCEDINDFILLKPNTLVTTDFIY